MKVGDLIIILKDYPQGARVKKGDVYKIVDIDLKFNILKYTDPIKHSMTWATHLMFENVTWQLTKTKKYDIQQEFQIENKECQHESKLYTGLIQQFYYCIKCDKKLDNKRSS